MSTNKGQATESSKSLLQELLRRMSGVFHLWDQTDRVGTIESITEGIDFRGASIWSLAVAILLASIGLNTNSTALIIGAMLVSPLMGPIMGAGMALGIYDTALLKRSLVNLGLMTGISLVISFIYFSLSPLRGITPELLARTTPTFFDVLVALFGGTAMIVAVSRKSRSTNTIAGVAVATALMPPLCTAGFGLANQNIGIFAGAAYLYLINSVFIGLTTFTFTKYLKLGKTSRAGKPVLSHHQIVLFALIALVFLAPSVYMAWDVIQTTNFQSRVDRFIALNMQFPESQISNVIKKRANPRSSIQLTITGVPLSEEMINHLTAQLPEFGLKETDLKIIQNSGATLERTVAAPIVQPEPMEIAKPSISTAAPSSAPFDRTLLLQDVSHEIYVLFPGIEAFSWGDMLVTNTEVINPAKIYTVLVKWKDDAMQKTEQTKLMVFLKLRLKTESLNVANY